MTKRLLLTFISFFLLVGAVDAAEWATRMNQFTGKRDFVRGDEIVGSLSISENLTAGDAIWAGGSASGQSIISSGLVVNEDGGNAAQDDFRVESGNYDDMLFVDASADKVGVGTSSPQTILDIRGDVSISNGLSVNSLFYVENDKVGIGTTSPQNKLDVEGGAVIGATYSGTNTAPSNGLLVEGNVGIGTATPGAKLDINGDCSIDGCLSVSSGFTVDEDGYVKLIKDGRAYKNEWLDVGSLRVPGTSPATAVDWGISLGYEFTNGAEDIIYDTVRLPQDMDKTDAPEFKIGWASDTNSGAVVWQLEYLYCTANEDTTAAAQETLTVTSTVSATTDGLTIATITGMDLPAESDQLLMIRIKRLGSNGEDTLADDAVMLGCGLKYTLDKLGVKI